MVNLIHNFIFSLLWLQPEPPSHDGQQLGLRSSASLTPGVDRSQSVFSTTTAGHSKSIAIIGAGTSGLVSLKILLDVGRSTKQDWEIVLFEKRSDVGGIWLSEEKKPEPPELPETPMHKELRTNGPHPLMAYPNFPFPPMTNLMPMHDAMEQYHLNFTSHFNLRTFIRFNHTVTSAAWVRNSTSGFWNLTISHGPESTLESHVKREYKFFDHLVVATGNNQYPHIETWPGMDDWLLAPTSGGRRRKALHSIYYEGSEEYINRTVLVVGNGGSGMDIMLHTTPVTRKIYWSFRDNDTFVNNQTLPYLPPRYDLRPGISHFTTDHIIFSDGSNCSDVDTIILATGYEKRIPFLEEGGVLHVLPEARSNDTYDLGLVSNLNYYFPLYQHIMPVVPQLPANALGIMGVPEGGIPHFYSSVAQSLYFAYAIFDPSILPSREDMFKEIYLREEELRKLGIDPYRRGHLIIAKAEGELVGKRILDYIDELVVHLKNRHVAGLPDDGKPFVEQWRRDMFAEIGPVILNWLKIMRIGGEKEKEFLRGAKTEKQWAETMHKVANWKGD